MKALKPGERTLRSCIAAFAAAVIIAAVATYAFAAAVTYAICWLMGIAGAWSWPFALAVWLVALLVMWALGGGEDED